MATAEIRIKMEKSLNLSGRSVEVVVGRKDPTTFSVHENLICAASDFFKSALNGGWKPSETRMVRLENDEPDVFSVYLHWLYRQTLPVRNDDPRNGADGEYLRLAKTYVLGDSLLDVSFKDAVLDAMLLKSRTKASDDDYWYPGGDTTSYIYNNMDTLDSSKARALVVDLYRKHGHGGWLRKWGADDIPKQFLFDLAVAFLDSPASSMPNPPSPCTYHEHPPGACYLDSLEQ